MGQDRLHPKLPLSQIFLDVGEVLLGHGKVHIERTDLVDDHQRRVIRLDGVSRMDHQVPGSTFDGRVDGAITQLDFSGLDRRLARLHRGLKRRSGGVKLIILIPGHDPALKELFIAGRLRLRVFFKGLIFRQIRFRLMDRGYKGA